MLMSLCWVGGAGEGGWWLQQGNHDFEPESAAVVRMNQKDILPKVFAFGLRASVILSV